VRIPPGIRCHKIKLTRFRMDVWVIDMRGEYNGGVGVLVVILFGKMNLEFKDGIVVNATAEEDNTVEEAERVEGGNNINS